MRRRRIHRFMTQNLLLGGGTRIAGILSRVSALAPDTVVFTEFREGMRGDELLHGLRLRGLKYHVSNSPWDRSTGVLIVSRFDIARDLSLDESNCLSMKKYLSVMIDDVRVLAVHILSGKLKQKSFRLVAKAALDLLDDDALLIGDFNTGKCFFDNEPAASIGNELPNWLDMFGYKDTWRSKHPKDRESTWYSHSGKGFRHDCAYASPSLFRRLIDVDHDHQIRESGLSDHSGLVVDFKRRTRSRSSMILPHMDGFLERLRREFGIPFNGDYFKQS